VAMVAVSSRGISQELQASWAVEPTSAVVLDLDDDD
jgi:hypothetical protein